MLRRNLWKILICLTVISWAVNQLLPIKDTDFVEYARKTASADQAGFAKLLDEAKARFAAKQARSEFVALKEIAKERNLDLTVYYPHLYVEKTLKNKETRNDILLTALLKRSKSKLQLGLDLKGGVAVTFEAADATPTPAGLPAVQVEEQRKEDIQKAIEILGRRVNGFGVSDAVIRPVGSNRIEMQLPGINTKDNPEILEEVQKPALLELRVVHPYERPGPGVETPANYEILTQEHEDKNGEITTEELFVKRLPEMTGKFMDSAYVGTDQTLGRPQVHLDFTSEGERRFGDVTQAILDARGGQKGGRLAVVLDGRLYSSPSVNERINGDAVITGIPSEREAFKVANALNNPLDVPLKIVEQYEVEPTLAADSVISARTAFIVSTLLTIGFMIVFYTIGGLVAAIGMGVNVIVTLAIMCGAPFNATLTLPGIAGIVLTLAMSVDANILIFERMREELRLGKTLASALEAGFDKAWSAILDSNITTFIAAAIMYVLGTGAVKGFGLTLGIGIFATMFAAVVVSKLALELLIHGGLIKSMRMFSILQDTKYDFARMAKVATIVSAIVIVIGLSAVGIKGRSVYGIDFLGGDMATLSYTKRLEVAELRKSAEQAGFKDVAFTYQKALGTGREVLRATAPFDKGDALIAKLQEAHPDAKLHVEGESRIGPSVGKEIQLNAAWSVFWALSLILVYIAFRFEIGYGVGGVVATVHDILMTIGIFVLLGRQFNASMVAAILLIVGYSINDKIVVFDRIREELKLNPVGSLRDLINRSINLTLSRTIITGGTTLLTAIVLIAVTTGDVNDIAVTLLIGVITGTYSSILIATPVFYWWHKGDRKHVEAHHDIAPKYEWQGSSKASH